MLDFFDKFFIAFVALFVFAVYTFYLQYIDGNHLSSRNLGSCIQYCVFATLLLMLAAVNIYNLLL